MFKPGWLRNCMFTLTLGLIVVFSIAAVWSIARQNALAEYTADVRIKAAAAGKAYDELDLAAQQQMALWAKWTFWLTISSVALSAVALVGLWKSLQQTREAITDNRRLGEAQTRAYVHAASARHAWTDTGYGLLINVLNVGQTPASHFEVCGQLRKVKHGDIEKSLDQFVQLPMKGWTTLGPGQAPTDVRLDISDYLDIVAEFGTPQEGYVLLVDGSIRYRDMYGHWFETRYAFWSHTVETGQINGRNKLRRPTSRLRAYEAVAEPLRSAGTL